MRTNYPADRKSLLKTTRAQRIKFCKLPAVVSVRGVRLIRCLVKEERNTIVSSELKAPPLTLCPRVRGARSARVEKEAEAEIGGLNTKLFVLRSRPIHRPHAGDAKQHSDLGFQV